MKLGLGTVQLGMAYGVANRTGQPDVGKAQEILSEAWQAGIHAYDTAASYGGSETIIGAFVSNHHLQEKIQIATKAGGFSQHSQSGASLKTMLQQSLEGALEKLHVPYIDYFLLHNPQDLHYNTGIVDFFQEAKSDGLIHAFGISAYTADDIGQCLSDRFRTLMDVIQIPFNILDQRLVNDGTLAAMKSRGIEVHARSVYLQGLIAMEPESLPMALQPAAPYLTELNRIAQECGLTRTELAHCYVRDCDAIDKMFIGCETLAQLRGNLRMHALPPIDCEKVQRMAQIFATIPENILNPALWRLT